MSLTKEQLQQSLYNYDKLIYETIYRPKLKEQFDIDIDYEEFINNN